MKGIAKALTVVWLLIGVSSAEATVPSISLETLSSADFGTLSNNPHSAYGFNGAFAVSSFDWNLSTQFGPLGSTIEEREFQQNMRELTASLQAYADQLPDRIQIGWIECFESAEERQSSVNLVVRQWSTYDPAAALEWISNPDLSEEGQRQRLNSLESQWAPHDPVAAAQWLANIDSTEDRRDRLRLLFADRMGLAANAASSDVNAVPEPKAYGLLAGTLAICLVILRRDFRNRR